MRKKGFTLIELLAVILILGIIALIAIPTVTNIIEESKRGAFKTTVQNLLSTVEQDCQLAQLKGEEKEKTYTFKDGKVNMPLNVKGELPKSGVITVDDSCNVSATNLSDGTFIASKEFESDKIDVKKESVDSEVVYVCKRATSLHEEECEYESVTNYGYTCQDDGYTQGSTIKYGNETTTKGTLNSGDAFDCDVNGDGTYDSDTERFYYVSDYYNTTTKSFETDKAVLVYYSNTKYVNATNVKITNSENDDTCHSGNSVNGPTTAIKDLPTTSQWSNINLINNKRSILTAYGLNTMIRYEYDEETYDDVPVEYNLPTAFSYEKYASRLLTLQEINASCSEVNYSMPKSCNYLAENTSYSNSDNIEGYWLENSADGAPGIGTDCGAFFSDMSWNYDDTCLGYLGVRPAIELSKNQIQY